MSILRDIANMDGPLSAFWNATLKEVEHLTTNNKRDILIGLMKSFYRAERPSKFFAQLKDKNSELLPTDREYDQILATFFQAFPDSNKIADNDYDTMRGMVATSMDVLTITLNDDTEFQEQSPEQEERELRQLITQTLESKNEKAIETVRAQMREHPSLEKTEEGQQLISMYEEKAVHDATATAGSYLTVLACALEVRSLGEALKNPDAFHENSPFHKIFTDAGSHQGLTKIHAHLTTPEGFNQFVQLRQRSFDKT